MHTTRETALGTVADGADVLAANNNNLAIAASNLLQHFFCTGEWLTGWKTRRMNPSQYTWYTRQEKADVSPSP